MLEIQGRNGEIGTHRNSLEKIVGFDEFCWENMRNKMMCFYCRGVSLGFDWS
jgi:hypothetical protein